MQKFRKDPSKNASKYLMSESIPDCLKKEDLDILYKFIKFCKFTGCRRNCKSNPLCLSGLGESQWLSKNKTELDTFEDPKEQCRTPGTHVGLENLGATCYVNSLLQLWFHTPQFRRAIFDWNPLEDTCEQSNHTVLDYNAYHPVSQIGQLQVLFALMSCSKRRYLNPSEFIQSLGLDTSTQQDAQEFSKLFLNLIEKKLESQSLPYVKNLVSDNFKGEYCYVTRCSKCKTQSINPSQFFELELNLKGNKNLDESLSEFLKEEKLDGANCYSCAVCAQKQEAARFIDIKSLPPILNFQLMRFVYDRQKGDKKKLNTAIQFPEVLDMKKYVKGAKEGQLLYHLTAVLAHRGLSANSGHYIAYIQDNDGDWYIFNDESVEKNTDGKKQKLKLDEDDDFGKKSSTNSRVPKGFLSSTKAYMLVYRRVSLDEQGSDKLHSQIGTTTLSKRLQEYINRHNTEFDSWFEETSRLRNSCVESGIEFFEQMKTLINSLPLPENADWSMVEAISTNWICHWLKSCASKTDPIDNSKCVCPHGSLNPDQVSNVKYISAQAAEELYKKYGGGPRMKGELICCKECANSRNRLLFLKNKLIDDAKEISILLKTKMEDGEPGFWIDKESLKNWKSKVELERKSTDVNSSCELNDEKKERGYAVEQSLSKSDVGKSSPEQVSNSANNTEKDSGLQESNHNESGHSIREQSMAFSTNRRDSPTKGKKSTKSVQETTNDVRQNKPSALRSVRNFRKRQKSVDECSASSSQVEPDEKDNFTLELSQKKLITGHLVNGAISCVNGSTNYMDSFSEIDTILNRLNVALNKIKTEDSELLCDMKQDCVLLKSVYSILKSNIISSDENRSCNDNNYHYSENTVSKTVHNSDSDSKTTPNHLRDSRTALRSDDAQNNSSSCVQDGLQNVVVNDSIVERHNYVESVNLPVKETSGKDVSDCEKVDNCKRKKEKTDSQDDGDDEENEDDDDDDDDRDLPFNERLVCTHGNLSIDESIRRLVPVKVWEILGRYFPNCRTFTHDTIPCQQCQSLASKDEAVKDRHRRAALFQKEQLKDLFIGRNRPVKMLPGIYYVISKEYFIDPWKIFLRKPEEENILTSLNTSFLLCQHKKMIYHPDIDHEKICLLKESEWNALKEFYSCDATIVCETKDDGQIETVPELCYPCRMERHEEEEKAQLNFVSANVYVHKVNTINLPTISEESNEPKGKKFKLEPEAQLQMMLQKSNSFVRRSSRRKRIRGEKAIRVSSTTLIRDFKVLVMDAFKVATYDQQLVTECGKVLNDNLVTFRDMEIYPETTIYLKVEEDAVEMEEAVIVTQREPEAGFKGTKLFS